MAGSPLAPGSIPGEVTIRSRDTVEVSQVESRPASLPSRDSTFRECLARRRSPVGSFDVAPVERDVAPDGKITIVGPIASSAGMSARSVVLPGRQSATRLGFGRGPSSVSSRSIRRNRSARGLSDPTVRQYLLVDEKPSEKRLGGLISLCFVRPSQNEAAVRSAPAGVRSTHLASRADTDGVASAFSETGGRWALRRNRTEGPQG